VILNALIGFVVPKAAEGNGLEVTKINGNF